MNYSASFKCTFRVKAYDVPVTLISSITISLVNTSSDIYWNMARKSV
jgi:hypothetical protein